MRAESKIPSTIEAWRSVLKPLADERGDVPAHRLREALGIRDDFLAGRFFSLLHDVTPGIGAGGSVSVEGFLALADRLVYGSPRERLTLLFRLHDEDGNGVISRDELTRMMQAGLREHDLVPVRAGIDALVSMFIERVDENGDGVLTCEELIKAATEDSVLLEQLMFGGLNWIVAPSVKRREPAPAQAPVTRWRPLGENSLVVGLVLYVVVSVAMAGLAAWRYAAVGANVWVQIARACGALLNFNGALILLPMLRRVWTWVRRTAAAPWLPLDHSVIIHQVIGHVLLWSALVHTFAHLMNAVSVRELLMLEVGVTGCVALAAALVQMWFARAGVRRSGHFERFHRAHMIAFVIWFGATLFHGPVFWQWALLPFIFYWWERLLRWRRRLAPTEATALTCLPSQVTRLEMLRPPGFDYCVGDYVYICVPALARHEWHPFTLTSSPEDPGHLSVHMRALGNWTRALHALAKDRKANETPLQVHLDGPYGTPSGHIFESRRAVLIGAGIGVTPYASLLRSVLLRRRLGLPMSIERVHFFWINRDQASFEWFTALLSSLEQEDRDGLLDLHVYMTGAKQDIRSSTLDAAMDMFYRRTGLDLLTGLRTRTYRRRPDWTRILQKIVAATPADRRCDVFFCGPQPLARELSTICAKLGMRFRQEHF